MEVTPYQMERSLPSAKKPPTTTDLMISTDASSTGWGEECMGTRTGGPWSDKESERWVSSLEAI